MAKNKDTPKIDNTLDAIKETKPKKKKPDTPNKVGRPPAFKSKEDLEQKIQAYKDYLEEKGKPPTIAGLAYFLDVDRQTLYNYGKKEQYFGVIKKAVDWIISTYEESCAQKANAGIIFLMKNYGYTDRETNSLHKTDYGAIHNRTA